MGRICCAVAAAALLFSAMAENKCERIIELVGDLLEKARDCEISMEDRKETITELKEEICEANEELQQNMQDIEDLEATLTEKEDELKMAKDDVREREKELMEREAELHTKQDALEIRKKGLDTLLSDEEKHFNQKLDALKMDLEAANDEHARLDLLLVNGVADREEKFVDAVEAKRAKLQIMADAKDKELAIAKKSLDLIKEFNSAKIEVTDEQTHSHVKPRHKRAKKLCKDAKEQVVSARAHLKAERQRTFKLRQRLWELQGMEGDLEHSDSDSGWEYEGACGGGESSDCSESDCGEAPADEEAAPADEEAAPA